jgi:sodium/potassium/calcium exchanger 6
MDKETRCAFAQTCNDGDGIFAPIFYCSETYSTQFLCLCLGPPLILFLIILFRILGSTAEEFFSPGLEMMSLEMGLPERFAGVTLLALGNGAPDVASTVNAILNDRKLGYLMALGELTGAAMVASTVIVGAVTFVSNGVSCRGALVRDVIMFILTMIVVYLAFNDGTISLREIHFFVFMYLAYVVVVLAADVYHRKIVVPKILLARQKSSEEVVERETTALVSDTRDRRSYSVASYELDHPEPKPDAVRRYRSYEIGQHPPKKTGTLERVIEALSNYDVESNGDESDRSEGGGEQITSERSASGWGHLEMDGTEPLMVFHPHHGGLVDLKHTERNISVREELVETVEIDVLEGRQASRAPQSWAEAWTTAWPELADYFSKFWRETYYNDDYNVLDKFLMTCELPFMIMRMVSGFFTLVYWLLSVFSSANASSF